MSKWGLASFITDSLKLQLQAAGEEQAREARTHGRGRLSPCQAIWLIARRQIDTIRLSSGMTQSSATRATSTAFAVRAGATEVRRSTASCSHRGEMLFDLRLHLISGVRDATRSFTRACASMLTRTRLPLPPCILLLMAAPVSAPPEQHQTRPVPSAVLYLTAPSNNLRLTYMHCIFSRAALLAGWQILQHDHLAL